MFGTLGRICNPAALNISICNAIIGLFTHQKIKGFGLADKITIFF